MHKTTSRDYALGILCVLIATAGWSLAGLFVRVLPVLSGWQINCWRGLSMALALLLWLGVIYGARLPAKFREIPLPALFSCAGFFTLGSTMYVISLTLTNTANVSCIGATAPIFTAVLSRLVMGERSGWAAWVAAGLAIAGVTYIVGDSLGSGSWLGNLVALGTAASFAGQTVTLRRYRAVDMVPAVAAGGFLTFIVAGTFGGFAVPREALPVLMLMGPVQLAGPLILYARGARHVAAVTLSLIALLDVVLNPFWAWLGAGEIPPAAAYVGGAMIVLAVMVSVFGGRRAAA